MPVKLPIVTDLDGTFIKSDMAFETAVKLVRKSPFYIFSILVWLFKGRAWMKHKILEEIEPDIENLPYNMELIEILQREYESGREIYLATASHQKIADIIADRFDFIKAGFGSNESYNLKSKNKANFLNEKFGDKGFIYAGDSSADIAVWENASEAIVVNASSSTQSKAEKLFIVFAKINNKQSFFKSFINEIRVYQWVKNILIFLPLLLAHTLESGDKIMNAILAFFAFSLTASSVYVTNDLLDINSDRRHPRKRNRPIASGDFPILHAIITIPFLLFAGIVIGYLVNIEFFVVLLLYLIATTSYSFILKKIALADVIILAGLYTLRILAGGYAAEVPISPWLLAFSLFLFFSLALVKRYTELLMLINKNKVMSTRRGYDINDNLLLLAIGPASGFMAILVFALYIQSDEVVNLYRSPNVLWLLTPLLLFWITRIWMLAHRGKMHDDPIVFTVKDTVSYLIGLGIGIITIYAALW